MDALLGAAHWLVAAVYPVAVAAAVVSDAKRLIIPNWTAVAVAVAYLPAALLAGVGPGAIALHYATGAGLLLVGMAAFAGGLMGGGDVKLLAAVGVWAGWPGLWLLLVLAAVGGGVLALLVLAGRRAGGRLAAALPWLGTEPAKRQPIPYGVAIGLSALLVFTENAALPPAWTAFFGG